MADLLHLIDGIVNEYLKTKDKNLAKVFETKTKAVSFFLIFFYLFFTASSFKCIHMYAREDGVGKNVYTCNR